MRSATQAVGRTSQQYDDCSSTLWDIVRCTESTALRRRVVNMVHNFSRTWSSFWSTPRSGLQSIALCFMRHSSHCLTTLIKFEAPSSMCVAERRLDARNMPLSWVVVTAKDAQIRHRAADSIKKFETTRGRNFLRCNLVHCSLWSFLTFDSKRRTDKALPAISR